MKKYYLRAFTFMVMLVVGMTQQMLAADDLQDYLNRLSTMQTRGETEQTVIDLSEYASTVRETTLTIKGVNVKFINGTLSGSINLEGPIVTVYAGGRMELGDKAIIDGSQLLGGELVTVDDAELVVSETGTITINGVNEQKTRAIPPQRGDYFTAVKLMNAKSVFTIHGGLIDNKVVSENGDASMSFYGGEVNHVKTVAPINIGGDAKVSRIDTSADVYYLSSDATIGVINFTSRKEHRLELCSHLTKDIIVNPVFDGWEDFSFPDENMFMNYVYDGDVVATAADGLTAEDVSHIYSRWSAYVIAYDYLKLEREYEYVVENEGRDLVIRPKAKAITTADDLQEIFDEMAEGYPYQEEGPYEIVIPEEGIVIDKQLNLRGGFCDIIITGGNISFSADSQYHSVFYSESYGYNLIFKNMAIDFTNCEGISYFVKLLSGDVTFDEGVEFINIPVDNKTGLCDLAWLCSVSYKSGDFFSTSTVIDGAGSINIDGGTIKSENTAIIGRYVDVNGGTVVGGNVVIDIDMYSEGDLSVTEGATIKSTKKNAYLAKMGWGSITGGTFVGEGARIYVDCHYMVLKMESQTPILELGNTAYIRVSQETIGEGIISALTTLNNISSTEDERAKALIYLSHYKKTIISNWAERELNKDVIMGITEDEFKYLFEFIDVPENLEVYYNAESQSAQLREVKVNNNHDDLQDFLNSLGDNKGTEENPVEILIADDFDLGGDVNLGGDGDDLQAFIDGLKDDGSNKTLSFNGGNINIVSGSTLTISNIDFVTTGRGGCINVSGTLIIDININIINIIQFIHVIDGGRVIWNGGGGTSTEVVINITGGTVEYNGGGYSGGHYGFSNNGGTIYVSGGTLGGGWSGGYTYYGGSTYIRGGHVSGGYINWGHTTITGGSIIGTITGGNGGGRWTVENGTGGTLIVSGGVVGGDGSAGGVIGNGGDLYLDGGTHGITDIHVIRDGRIYINFDLTVIIRIHINITDIVLNTPIILGYDGYRLTEDKLKNIEIILPDGYRWEFDSVTGAIIIVSTTGINDAMTEKSEIESVYSIGGQKQHGLQKGLNIVRRKDGTVEKVMVK